MTSHGIKILEDPTNPGEKMILRNLLQKIRKYNKRVKICVETDRMWDSGNQVRQSYLNHGFYPIWTNNAFKATSLQALKTYFDYK